MCGTQKLCSRRNGIVAIQTFGDFPLGFHPHLHILVTDGCFHENGMFSASSTVDTKVLEQIFRHKVLPARRGTSKKGLDHTDYSHSQVPLSEDHLYCDPDYPIEIYASS